MKRLLFWLIVAGVIGGGAAAGYSRLYSVPRRRQAVSYRESPPRRRRAGGQLHRHGEAGAERAGGGVCFRSRSEGLRRFQRQGEEGPGAGTDRPADLQVGRGPRPGVAGPQPGRPGPRQGPPGPGRPHGAAGGEIATVEGHLRDRFRPGRRRPEIAGGPGQARRGRHPGVRGGPGHRQDEPRFHRHPLAGGRHRDRPQGRSGADRGRPVSDPGDVRRRPGPGEEGLRLCLRRRGGHRPDPRGPKPPASRSPSPWTRIPRTFSRGGSPRCGSTPRRSRTSSPTRWWWRPPTRV